MKSGFLGAYECIRTHSERLDHDKLRTPQAPQGGVPEMCKNPLDLLVFPAWVPIVCANGFPGSQTVSRNPSKAMEDEAKSQFLRAQTVTGPWPCVGDSPGNGVSSNAKLLGIIGN